MTKIILLALAAAVLVSVIPNQDALAYRCPDERDAYGSYTPADLAKIDYEERVNAFNTGVDSRSGSIEDLNRGLMTGDGIVNELNQMTGCLYEIHRVDPDSVASFSEKAQDVLSYDMEKLIEIAPNLAKYATVPEFSSTVSIILVVGVVSGIIFSKKLHTKI